jgi:hypothetical protein
MRNESRKFKFFDILPDGSYGSVPSAANNVAGYSQNRGKHLYIVHLLSN